MAAGQLAGGVSASGLGDYDAKLKQAITNRHTLWMHAVSVGEVNVCTQLIRALEPRLPNLKIVVSTTTTTGMGELQRKLPTHISKIYYPMDSRTMRHPRAELPSTRRRWCWWRRRSGRIFSGVRSDMGSRCSW